MLVNPHPYGAPDQPLNDKPWRGMKTGADLISLVDADIFTYSAGFSIEHSEPIAYDYDGCIVGHWRNKQAFNTWVKKNPKDAEAVDMEQLDFHEWIEPLDKAELIIRRKKQQIRDATHRAKQWWYLTEGSTLWRNDDATIQEYKGNRKEMRKPVYYDEIRQFMVNYCGATVCKGLEADDSVAALGWELPGEVIIVSGDKDLRTIPGLHANPSKLKDGIVFVSELSACRFLYSQMLSGDKIDNIKGLSGDRQNPGWGPVKSQNAMAQFVTEYDMAEYVAEQYARTYPDGVIGYDGETHLTWQEMLVETANLLFLRRYHDTQFEWVKR